MYAAVMELVDLVDSKSSALGRVGSNPTCGTTNLQSPQHTVNTESEDIFYTLFIQCYVISPLNRN